MSRRYAPFTVIVGLVPTIHVSARAERWTFETMWLAQRPSLARHAAKTATTICILLTTSVLPAKAEDTCKDGRLIPAQYKEDEVEATYAAHDRLHIIPATYKTITDEVITAPAHCPGETLKTITQTVILEEPSERLQVIPATFEIDTDYLGETRRIVKTKASVMRASTPPHPPQITTRIRAPNSANNACAPEDMIPAVTRTIKRRVIDTPASVKSERVPETTRTITEKVLIAPERCEHET